MGHYDTTIGCPEGKGLFTNSDWLEFMGHDGTDMVDDTAMEVQREWVVTDNVNKADSSSEY